MTDFICPADSEAAKDCLCSVFSRLNQISEKLDQILSFRQCTVEDLDEIQGPIHDEDLDLIDRFCNELRRYQIDLELIPGTYDAEVVRNKASYYFNSLDKITNRRAYLSRLTSQIIIKPINHKKAVPVSENVELEAKARIEYLRPKVGTITDEQIKYCISESTVYRRMLSDVDNVRAKDNLLLIVADWLDKRGLI